MSRMGRGGPKDPKAKNLVKKMRGHAPKRRKEKLWAAEKGVLLLVSGA